MSQKVTTRAILESFALPRHSVKKNILAAQAEYESNYPSFFRFPSSCILRLCHTLMFLPLSSDRDPGNVEVLTDLLLEKWRNVPEARQLGEESAKFFRQEMEATWGQGHLAVLSEDEAQKWLLGVSPFVFFLGLRILLSPSKILQILQYCIGHLNTKCKQVVLSIHCANF